MKISELKSTINLPTGKFVLFTIITGGIYPILWITKYASLIKKTFEIEDFNFPKNYEFYLAISVGLGAYFNSLVRYDAIFSLLGSLFGLVTFVLYIVWAFKIKNSIVKYTKEKMNIDYKMNPIYTFLFTVYYINYCINELGEIEEKN